MRRLAWFAGGLSAGVFLCRFLLPQGVWITGGGGCLALFALSFLCLKGRRRAIAALLCAGLAAGCFWTAAYDRLVFQPAQALDNQTIRLTGTVRDYPMERDYGCSVVLDSEVGKVLLYLDEQGESLRPGDTIETVAHCTLGSYSANREEITYYTAKGIFLWGKGYGKLTVTRPESIPFRYWGGELAHRLKGGIDAALAEPAAGIVRAVVTGSRDKLTDEFTSSLERTGLSHTVAVSGMHLACFAGILSLLLGRGRRSTALLVIFWAALFWAVAGGTPSVSRAAVMILLLQLAPLLGRERDDPTALALALMVLLVWNPYSAAHVGLQLSFAAVAGIQWTATPIQNFLLKKLHLQPKRTTPVKGALLYLPRGLVSIFAATMGAMVFTVPLTAIHFGTVSLIAPLSNLLSLWAVTGLFVLGMGTGLLALVWLPGAKLLAIPVSWLAAYLDKVTHFLSGFTYSALSMESFYYRAWLIFLYLALAGAVLVKGKRRWILPACCGVITLTLAVTLTALSFQQGEMTVAAIDVGQGQSILLRSGNHLTVVDCGGDGPDNAGDLTADYLQGQGYGKIDLLVLTHCHADHANGVPQLLKRLKVGTLMLPEGEEDSPLRQEIFVLAQELGIETRSIGAESRIDLAPGHSLILYPPMGKELDPNEQGLTLLAAAGDFEVLVTGDMSGEVEGELLRRTELPDIEVLVVGHHGAQTSTTEALLTAATPDIALISAGRNNRYGHPHAAVLERLAAMGIEIYRTDLHGTVTVSSG